MNIREISGRRELRKFVRFPFLLYRDDPYWVPPLIRGELKNLDPHTNPAFSFTKGRYWLAEDERGRVRGRVAAFLPKDPAPEPSDHDQPRAPARFGCLDFEDHRDISRGLLEAVEQWVKAEGHSEVQGPYGVTTFDTSAILVEGFEELPTAASSYNFPYYGDHLEACGYEKEVDYLEYEIANLSEVNPRVAKLAAFTMKRKKVRLLDLTSRNDIRRHAPEAFEVINEAYTGLHGFEPLTREQISYYTEAYFSFLDPAFVKILVDESGRMAAVGISMPSLSRGLQAARGRLFPLGFLRLLRAVKKTDTLDLYLVAVRREWQNAGLPAILMNETHKALVARGMNKAETNGELETNQSVQALWSFYGARQHKRRRVYRKALS